MNRKNVMVCDGKSRGVSKRLVVNDVVVISKRQTLSLMPIVVTNLNKYVTVFYSGKHTPAKFRNKHSTEKAVKIKKEYILPVVTMRNPYSWYKSMCHNCYAAHWRHGRADLTCPKLKDPENGEWNPVHVRYGEDREDDHISLAHMWNDWYGYYLKEADYPFVAVRMEDLVFYPKETIGQVCECAGGKIRTDQAFKFVVESAKKDSPGHDKTTGIYEAWIKYSKPAPAMGGFSEADFLHSYEALNQTLMDLMGYHHPPAS